MECLNTAGELQLLAATMVLAAGRPNEQGGCWSRNLPGRQVPGHSSSKPYSMAGPSTKHTGDSRFCSQGAHSSNFGQQLGDVTVSDATDEDLLLASHPCDLDHSPCGVPICSRQHRPAWAGAGKHTRS